MLKNPNRLIIRRMKKKYTRRFDIAKKEVKSNRSLAYFIGSWCTIISAILLLVYYLYFMITLEVIPWFCKTDNLFEDIKHAYDIRISIVIYVILFLSFIVTTIGIKKSKQYFDDVDTKRNEIMRDVIQDEMNRFNMSNEFELFSMIQLNYDGVPLVSKIIAILVNLIFICVSVAMFPAYDQENYGILIFILFVALNFFAGEAANWAVNLIKVPGYFYNYLINQYATSKMQKLLETRNDDNVINYGRENKRLKEENAKLMKQVSKMNCDIQKMQNNNLRQEQIIKELKQQLRKLKKKSIRQSSD